MKREIEVKAHVADIENLKDRLGKLGCLFSKPIFQHDYIYNKKGVNLQIKHGTPVLRIRKQNNVVIFTAKQDISGELDCLEKETEVDNIDVAKDIIEMIGFNLTVEVKKKRVKTKYNDLEICLDEVEGLGSFIEVEKLIPHQDDDGKVVQEELFKFLVNLGIPESDRVHDGYDSMLYKKSKNSI